MLRRLFKSRHRLSHPNAAERRAAVLALDADNAQALQDDLRRMLRNDSDVQVRLACIERITDPSALEPLLDDTRLGQAVTQRLLVLRPGAVPEAGRNPRHLQAELLALPSAEAAARLREIEDVDNLIELALKARGELRERILEHPLLKPAAALTALERRSRDRDKTLNRHARRRLERRKSLQHEVEACRVRAAELAAALRRHDPPAHDQAWRERQHELYRRLEETLDNHARLRAQLADFDEHVADLEALRMDPAELPSLEPPAPEPAPTDAATAQTGTGTDAAGTAGPGAGADPFEPLVEAFRALDEALTSAQPFHELAARRQELTERWLTTADHQPPSEAQHQVFEAVSHRFRELADAVAELEAARVPELPEEPLTWPDDDHPAPPSLWQAVEQRRGLVARLDRICRNVRWPDWAPPTADLQALRNTAARLHAELQQADALLKREVEALQSQVDALARAVDEGHLQEAQSLLGRTRSRHDALPHAATRKLSQRLGKEAARLAELKDWQTFATSPKRESLLEAMSELAAHPLEPRAQANRIKQLRREWQELGPVTRAADGRLADRFNAEAEKAFEPCRAYFAELAEERRANLAQRQRICDQLEHYLEDTDWAHADMKAAEQIMRAARDEWRTFHPVDRNPGKAVESRFEALQNRLHDLVKAEWDRNLAAKQALVDEARDLIDADLAVRDKVEAAKALQRRWRDVGITPRRPDQQLWRAFRGACDRIFAARDDARHAQDAALEALESRLGTELDDFEARLTGVTPRDAGEADLRDFRNRTADVERLPPTRRRSLADRRRALVERYQQLLDERRELEARDRVAAIERWDAAQSQAETAGHEAPAPPPGLPAEVVEARLTCAGSPVPLDALRRLTVRAELAAGRESPDDQALRMEIQVERLQAGLAGGGTPETAQALVADWCRLGPKDDSTAPLRERFFAALTALD